MRGRSAVVAALSAATASAVAIALVTRRRATERLRSGRAERTTELVKLTTSAGANYARMQATAAFASEEKKAELQARFELQTAEQVAEVLGNMKGAVMKLGQMASYLDGGLPEPVREALAQMQQDAPPMSFELVAGVIESELGAHPDEVFESFEREPMAAASIGQVHRAVTRDGRAVAVKVQYPGVDEAIRADLDNSDLLFGAMGMLFSGLDPAPIVNELRDRLVEELDYRIEAANQRRFVEYYRGHPTISVPDVVDEHSTERVLCTELATGARWADLLGWSQAERNLAAESLYRFAFGGIYRLGVFNGDPHPGNYLFNPGGKVVFLDYGLCKTFTPEEIKSFERLIVAMVLHGDPAEVRAEWTQQGVLTGGDHLSDAAVFDYFSHFFEQVMNDEVTEITSEYASDSLRRYFDLSGPHAEMMKSVTLPSSMVIIQRINLGLYALFGELRAENNWRRLAEEIWPFVDRDPSTPMGERIRAWEIERGHR
ncbi:MAG: AarF/ABC1/UbiB kinase family protein [Microthrixaceae bacterium]|nr:AarF/ABC1/UbiB kinase family protein [Microthrixaceae bacterium]